VLVNGKFCKNPSLYTPDDFSFSGFDVPGNTSNQLGVHVNIVTADLMPGLNTLGVSMARIDFAPNDGQNPVNSGLTDLEKLSLVLLMKVTQYI
jgi:hypothetical protein